MARKKKDMSWNQIGKEIGKKIEKESKKDQSVWNKSLCFHGETNGGGFGRFIFICSTLYAMHLMGMIEVLPLWLLALIVIGFTAMRI